MRNGGNSHAQKEGVFSLRWAVYFAFAGFACISAPGEAFGNPAVWPAFSGSPLLCSFSPCLEHQAAASGDGYKPL